MTDNFDDLLDGLSDPIELPEGQETAPLSIDPKYYHQNRPPSDEPEPYEKWKSFPKNRRKVTCGICRKKLKAGERVFHQVHDYFPEDLGLSARQKKALKEEYWWCEKCMGD